MTPRSNPSIRPFWRRTLDSGFRASLGVTVVVSVACGAPAVEWVSSEATTQARVQTSLRQVTDLDHPELVLSVLGDWDDWEDKPSTPSDTTCHVSFFPEDLVRAHVLWIGEGWVGTLFDGDDRYRALNPSEGALLAEAMGVPPGTCGLGGP